MEILLKFTVTVLNALGLLLMIASSVGPLWLVWALIWQSPNLRAIAIKAGVYFALTLSLGFIMVEMPLAILGYLNEATVRSADEIHTFSHNAVEIIQGGDLLEASPTETAVPVVIEPTVEPTAVITNLVATPVASYQEATATPGPDWIPETKDAPHATWDAAQWHPGDPIPTPSH